MERDRGVGREVIIRAIESALKTATARHLDCNENDIRVAIDRKTLVVKTFRKLVVSNDDVVALLGWSVDSSAYPLDDVAYFDYDGDGETDTADAIALAFRMNEDLDRILIAVYDGRGRMTQSLLLTADADLSVLRTAANVKLFFLSADLRPVGAAKTLG